MTLILFGHSSKESAKETGMKTDFEKIEKARLHYLPASEMHPADTYFHFSFASYYDPANLNFGVLRVLNDDEVRPESGFGRHPHRDMEIITYVVSGTLTHWDSATDTEEQINRGEVQVITAGTGVLHSELNRQKESCRLLQIWIMPSAHGLPVRYDGKQFSLQERENRLLQVVGNPANAGKVPLYVNQDVNVYVSEITDNESTVPFTIAADRQAYINCIEGELEVAGCGEIIQLAAKDSLKIRSQCDLSFKAVSGGGHFIIIEMAKSD